MTEQERTELNGILSDTLRASSDLLTWCGAANRRRTAAWNTLAEICESSAAPLLPRLGDYRHLANHPDIWVCHDTGASTYRCGVFQYTDAAMNYPFANPESLGPVIDFGWWDFYHKQETSVCKKQRGGLKARLFEPGIRQWKQMYEICEAFDRHYVTLTTFRWQHYRQILEAMPGPSLFADYALTALRGEELPENVSVVFPSKQQFLFDPHFRVGGAFSVMMLQNGMPVELHECNALGDSIYRTYFSF